MRIQFHGGAGEVTGSRYRVEVEGARLLLDCGMFQGHRREAIEKNRRFPFDPAAIQDVLLSHAHIDHSGSLPLLAKSGFRGRIHCARPTVELCEIMLMDSAHLQEEDAKFFNKIHQQDGQTIEPLYTEADVRLALKLFAPHDYEESFWLNDRVQARFLNAGHVLGSAMIALEAAAASGARHLLYTGDLGRQSSLLLNPPRIPPQAVDVLLLESTYGARVHEPVLEAETALAAIIQDAVREKGRILIPSFALERTQEILYVLEKLRQQKRIPSIPIYLDSPMAIRITEIFNKQLQNDSFSPEFKDYSQKTGDPFGLDHIRCTLTPEESKVLNQVAGPLIILAGSGMCEGGRILHHLRNHIDQSNTLILLVGYQAEGTLGRRLAEHAPKVKIFGLEHRVEAQVRVMPFFSAHADQKDLIAFVQNLHPQPQTVFLVHGDSDDRKTLTALLQAADVSNVREPVFGEIFDV